MGFKRVNITQACFPDVLECDLRNIFFSRVHDCINNGTDKVVDVAVDNGKWFELKKTNQLQPAQPADVPLLPYSGWKNFPGYPDDIPKHFNRGHIHHHIVESVQFLNAEAACNESDSDSDIEDLHTAKPLKRGETYLKSKNILKVQDCAKSGHYFLKAKIKASYSSTIYDVTASLSQVSGFVRDASCTCKSSAMSRCSHVTALLLALEDHVSQTSSDISCTSVPCTWNRGRQNQKTPRRVQELSYSSKKRKCLEVINFDPRAPSTVLEDEKQLTESLLGNIENSKLSDCMWYSILERQYSDYDLDPTRIQLLQDMRELFLQNLKIPGQSDDAFLLVSNQKSDQWYTERRVRLTASNCHTVVSFQSGSAISNFLSKKLWKTDPITTLALRYGQENEDTARNSYISLNEGKITVTETGLWVSGLNPELAASPDGIVFDPQDHDRYGLLEIKCPKMLENKFISDFPNILSKKQLQQFCLVKENDIIMMKQKHPYFSQIQMQMGVTGLKFCDFVVWSSKETFVTRVRFDDTFWLIMKEKLLTFHHSYLCPELFEMRLPRELSAMELK